MTFLSEILNLCFYYEILHVKSVLFSKQSACRCSSSPLSSHIYCLWVVAALSWAHAAFLELRGRRGDEDVVHKTAETLSDSSTELSIPETGSPDEKMLF